MSNKAIKKSTPRVASYRDRQLALNRKHRDPYLTDDEWVKVKVFISELRKET